MQVLNCVGDAMLASSLRGEQQWLGWVHNRAGPSTGQSSGDDARCSPSISGGLQYCRDVY
jgi:hypothetical protein